MVIERQVWVWVAMAAVLIVALWILGNILLPFVGGLALAYLLNPAANRLERHGVNRTAAALLLVGLLVLVVLAAILVIVPVLTIQLMDLIENLPDYFRQLQVFVTDPSRPWLGRMIGEGLSGAEQSIGEILKAGSGWAAGALGSLWTGGQAVLSLFALLVVMPVVAFYFVADWPRLIASIDGLVPLSQQETVRYLGREIDRAIAGFVRGQILVCLLLATFYGIGLTLAGLNFGLVIGAVAGLIGFIPYVGSITGFLLAGGVAIAQFWPEWTPIAVVFGVFALGQFLEGNILVPKLVGDSTRLHPVWLIFALFAFGYLFGFVGLLLAAPIAAAIGVLVRYFAQRYRESPLYTGEKAP